MIYKILTIKNVGLFADGIPAKTSVDFDKATIVYAENGRGKSTLASILRACSLGDTGRIIARRTADSTGDPEIKLIVQKGTSRDEVAFVGNAWTASYPDIFVFDSEFVDQNVYSGFEVRPDQRESLLEFALGDEAVEQKNQFEALSRAMEEQARKRSDAEKKLLGYMAPYELHSFIALNVDESIEDEIGAQNQQLSAASRANSILQRKLPESIAKLNFDIGIACDLLGRQLEDMADSAEAAVRAHLDTHQAREFEDWLNHGQSFLTFADCPFCGQPISGLELISAYRAYFSKAYDDLKAEVAKLGDVVRSQLSDNWLQTAKGSVETNAVLIEAWTDELQMDVPQLDLEYLGQELGELRREVETLVVCKQEQPLEAIGSHEDSVALINRIAAINERITAYNSCIAESGQKMADYKQQLSAVNVLALKKELTRLEAVQRRYQPDVASLVAEYQDADTRWTQIEKQRKIARTQLDNLMISTLEEYQERVNLLVGKFNAQFSIKQLKPTHKGKGNPRSEYVLSVRTKPIQLGSRDDTSIAHSFGNTLSEADKRTLAFAFFVARLEKDPQLNERIVVFDDPVSSLDLNRRKESMRLIAEIATKCRQVVILSHDAYFVRDLRNTLSDIKSQPKPTLHKILRVANGYSAFGPCDIDDICASDYYRHYRLVSNYVSGSSTANCRDVAKAIRPLLEGYFHRRFPDRIRRRDMFGVIITQAQTASSPDVLANLHAILGDLRRINDYASEFHHDTNPDADSVVINEAELHSYAQSALDVIHRNG